MGRLRVSLACLLAAPLLLPVPACAAPGEAPAAAVAARAAGGEGAAAPGRTARAAGTASEAATGASSGVTSGAAPEAASDTAAERRRAADLGMDELLPLDPEDIRRFLERRDAAASAAAPGPAVMRTRAVALAATPREAPHVVRLTQGYSSTLLFQDRTGAPWPVLSATLGDAQAFALSQPAQRPASGDGGGQAQARGQASGQAAAGHAHILTVVPLLPRASSSLVLTLEDAVWPVVLHLVAGGGHGEERVSDALTVLRLDRPGPGAAPARLGPSPEAADADLLAFMHGLVPDGAVERRLEPALDGVRAWSWKGGLYLRSVHPAVWPAWQAVAENEGLAVYRMPETPALVLGVEGRPVNLVLRPASGGAGREASPWPRTGRR